MSVWKGKRAFWIAAFLVCALDLVTKTLVVFLGRLVRPVDIQTSEHDGHRWVEWRPPHRIQTQTVDPLLAAVEEYRVAPW